MTLKSIIPKFLLPAPRQASVRHPAEPARRRPAAEETRRNAMESDDAGATLFDLVLYAIGLAFILVFLSQLLATNVKTVKGQQAAEQLKQVRQAAEAYITANFAAVDSQAASGPFVITTATLQSAGFLGPSFLNTNAYNQTHAVLVRQISAGVDQSLVVTNGGQTIDPVTAPLTAAMAGASGGYVPAANPTIAQGAYGGWQVALSPYIATGLVPPAGHLAALAEYDNGALVAPWLNRFAVAGNPDANTMHTAIDMNGNIVNNASDVFLNGKQRWLSQAIQDATVASNGATIPKPTCPSGKTPQIFVAPAIFSENATANPIAAVQASATDLGGSWQVSIRVLTQDGWTNPDATHGQMIVLTKCT